MTPRRDMFDVISRTLQEMVDGKDHCTGVLTALVVADGADVQVQLRHKTAPMPLVMTALAVVREADEAVARDGDALNPIRAQLAVARTALDQIVGDRR